MPLAGALEYVGDDGTTMTLAMLQAYVPNQGDGWAYTVGYLERYLEDRRTTNVDVPADVHGAYLALVQMLGQRTAELHLAFARPSGDPAFDPEPLTAADIAAYRERAAAELQAGARHAAGAPGRAAAQRARRRARRAGRASGCSSASTRVPPSCPRRR